MEGDGAGEGAFVGASGIKGVLLMRMVYMCMCVFVWQGGGDGCQCCKS